jgi:hypothetical protein
MGVGTAGLPAAPQAVKNSIPNKPLIRNFRVLFIIECLYNLMGNMGISKWSALKSIIASG